MALLDEIKNRLKKVQPINSTPTQAGVENLLQTKTGKAIGNTGPRSSNLGEQTAMAVGQSQQAQVSKAADMAASSIGQQQAALTQQKQSADNTLAAQQRMAQADLGAQTAQGNAQLSASEAMFNNKLTAETNMQLAKTSSAFERQAAQLTSQRGIAESDLFSQFRQSNEELAFRKDSAQLEQTAFTMAMKDKEYLDKLSEVGLLRNLQDELAFKQETARLMMGSNLDLIKNNVAWQTAYSKDDREWAKEMAKMDLNTAMQIASQSMQQANSQAVASGITQLAQQGVTYAQQTKPTETTQPQTNSVDYSASNNTVGNIA